MYNNSIAWKNNIKIQIRYLPIFFLYIYSQWMSTGTYESLKLWNISSSIRVINSSVLTILLSCCVSSMICFSSLSFSFRVFSSSATSLFVLLIYRGHLRLLSLSAVYVLSLLYFVYFFLHFVFNSRGANISFMVSGIIYVLLVFSGKELCK